VPVRSVDDLLALHDIQRLKHRYLRCLDQKAWTELETCFAEDATASYGGGAISLEGRDAILAFLIDALGSTSILTSHRGSQPEIDLVNPAFAEGVWALEDVVIHKELGLTIHGAAFYHDTYVRVGQTWLIQRTGYERTYEELWPRASIEGLRITADQWETGGRSSLL
jgi:hypothetical protein